MVKVTDGVMLPGKAYVVVVSKDVTIKPAITHATLTAEFTHLKN